MKQKAFPQKTPVKISWLDSTSQGGWQVPDRLTLQPIVSIGFVVDDTPEHITISTSMALDCKAWCLDPISIPWGCIRSIGKLRRNSDG